jgi:hypothetical protein
MAIYTKKTEFVITTAVRTSNPAQARLVFTEDKTSAINKYTKKQNIIKHSPLRPKFTECGVSISKHGLLDLDFPKNRQQYKKWKGFVCGVNKALVDGWRESFFINIELFIIKTHFIKPSERNIWSHFN